MKWYRTKLERTMKPKTIRKSAKISKSYWGATPYVEDEETRQALIEHIETVSAAVIKTAPELESFIADVTLILTLGNEASLCSKGYGQNGQPCIYYSSTNGDGPYCLLTERSLPEGARVCMLIDRMRLEDIITVGTRPPIRRIPAGQSGLPRKKAKRLSSEIDDDLIS